MRLALAVLFSFLAAAAEAAVAEAGDEQTARFELAQSLARSGEHAAALAAYEALMAASPDNVDYIFGYAQTLAWAERDAMALEEVERARMLAPEYEDVWRLQFSLLRRGGAAGRRALAALRPEAERRFPAADWWALGGADAQAGTELDFSSLYQTVSTQADWRSTAIRATHVNGSGTELYAQVEKEQRFGVGDSVIGAGVTFAGDRDWTAGAELAIGPDADFVPQSAVAGWVGLNFAPAWETLFRIRKRRYDTSEVASVAGTAARYIGKFRVAYTLDLARLSGADTSEAQIAGLNYYYSPRLEIDVTIAKGQEIEVTAPGALLSTGVTAISFGARHELGDRWRIGWWLGTHRQGSLYRRKYVGLSLAARL